MNDSKEKEKMTNSDDAKSSIGGGMRQLIDRQARVAVGLVLGMYIIVQGSVLYQLEVSIAEKVSRAVLPDAFDTRTCIRSAISNETYSSQLLLFVSFSFLMNTIYNIRSRLRSVFPFSEGSTLKPSYLGQQIFDCMDVVTICAGSSSFLQYLYRDDPTSHVTDWYGLTTSKFLWVEWSVTVPFMMYMIFAVDIKHHLDRKDVVAILCLVFMILSGASLNICTSRIQAMFLLCVSFSCYLGAFYAHYLHHTKLIRNIKLSTIQLSDKPSMTEAFVELRNSYRVNDMCVMYFFGLMYFPIVSIVGWFGFVDSVQCQSLFALGSLVVKLSCCRIVGDSSVHLEKEITTAYRLLASARNEKEIEHAQQRILRLTLSNVAHDLKTPLAGFSCGLSLIEDDVDKIKEHRSEEVLSSSKSPLLSLASHDADSMTPNKKMGDAISELLDDVQEQARDLGQLNAFMVMSINRCIDFVKASRGVALVPKYDVCEIKDVLRTARKCMSKVTLTSSQIAFLPPAPELSAEIFTDKQWFLENVFCLLSNAVKYSHNGHIVVSVDLVNTTDVCKRGLMFCQRKEQETEAVKSAKSVKRVKDRVNVESRKRGFSAPPTATMTQRLLPEAPVVLPSCILIEVVDSGIGLPSNHSKLFGAFQQLQKMAGGTGLGLFSLAKRLDALGGYYGAESRKDGKQGSVFWFAFPYRPVEKEEEVTQHVKNCVCVPAATATARAGESTAVVGPPATVPTSTSNSATTHPLARVLTPVVLESTSVSLNTGTTTVVNNNNNNSNTVRNKPETPSSRSRRLLSPRSNSFRRYGPSDELEEAAVAVAATAGVFGAQPQRAMKILLVEDSFTIQKMTKQSLQRAGHTVTCAVNGADALQVITEEMTNNENSYDIHEPPFDLVLCDICMPVMDGFEFTRRFRILEKNYHHEQQQQQQEEHQVNSSEYKRQLIIGLSADNNAAPEVLDAGMDDFIPKPFKLATMLSVLLLNKQQQQTQK